MNTLVSVASLASAAAVASPALAVGDTAGNPDAELLALGPSSRRLSLIGGRMPTANRRHRSDEAARRRAGMPRIEMEDPG